MPPKRKSSLSPFLTMGAGVVLILTAIIWQLTGNDQPGAAPTASIPSGQSQLPFPDVVRISLRDAKAAYDAGSALFLDVRDSDSYNASHIPGALNIEVAQLLTQLAKLDSSKSIITYCT